VLFTTKQAYTRKEDVLMMITDFWDVSASIAFLVDGGSSFL
jgi:hypothetical protein